MKILVLDIDGVLNVCYPKHDEFGSLFHPHFEDNLRYIIEQTGAKIVISSTWRFAGLSEMQRMWKERNLAGEVIDVTPDCALNIEPDENGNYERKERGYEVKEWLDAHPEVTHYAICDDDEDFLENQMNNFVRTSKNQDHPDCVDIGYGLTKICAEKVIEILNRK